MVEPMTKPSSRVPPSHRVPAHLARRFHQVCLGITAEVTERAGLTPVEFAVITALEDTPDIDQGNLAARLGIDAVSAHHLIHRLAAAGHVERRVNRKDRRARSLRLTARGQALRDRLRADARASQQRILAPLAQRERTLFLEMLTRLVEAHEAYARPGNGRRRAPRVQSPSSSPSALPPTR
jgi:MarR family transcriptional regulator, temperature-dependent positive regulator of motility